MSEQTEITSPKPPAQPDPGCCAPAVKATCCEPSDKAECCGAEATTGTCGCR